MINTNSYQNRTSTHSFYTHTLPGSLSVRLFNSLSLYLDKVMSLFTTLPLYLAKVTTGRDFVKCLTMYKSFKLSDN